MSKFATRIPVNADAVKQLLPAGAYVHGAKYDPASNAVVIEWEHGQLHTGLGFPIDFTQDQLAAKEVPAGVTDLRPTVADIARVENKPEPETAVDPTEPAGGKTRKKRNG